MRISSENATIAGRLREQIQRETQFIDDGEAVAMMLLWGFLLDHALQHGLDVEDLSRVQLEAFISLARHNLSLGGHRLH